MSRKRKEIKAVLHLPKSEQAILGFERKMGDFYAAQVEKRLLSLSKEQQLKVLDAIISSYR